MMLSQGLYVTTPFILQRLVDGMTKTYYAVAGQSFSGNTF